MTLAPSIRIQPALKQPTVNNVTVVMPFYDRIKYLKHYMTEGLLDGLKLQIVCDGSTEDLIQKVTDLFTDEQQVDIYSYGQNRGVAFARSKGIDLVKTDYLSFCDDDDFMHDSAPFFKAGAKHMNKDDGILFSAMPKVYAFDESLNYGLQYDRTAFLGKTGLELLMFLVKTGEMCVLTLGSVFRRNDLQGIGPEDFFKVSEDYVFLARLCARHPEKVIKIEEEGVYMRLRQENSLSARTSYSLDKITMHLVSMFVGAFYLLKMGHLQVPVFQHLLIERGKVLQESYGKGAEATLMMAGLLEKKLIAQPTPEQQNVLTFLESQKSILPPEFLWLVGWGPA